MTDRILTVVQHEDPSGAAVVAVSGELDHHTAPELKRALHDVPFTPETPTVIDLTELTYCDSTGITVVVTAYQRAKREGSGLVVAGLDSNLMCVVQIVGRDQILTFFPTVADAIESLKRTGEP